MTLTTCCQYPSDVEYFYSRLMSDDGSRVPRFSKQAVGHNKLAQIIPHCQQSKLLPICPTMKIANF